MSILVDERTRVLVQGITGMEGSKSTREMIAYGTKVVAGVTPGKAGQNVENVPVYDSVADAIQAHPEINATVLYVPAPALKQAAIDAIDAGISLVNIITEHVPIQDMAYIYSYAKKKGGVRIVGPSSVGILSPGKCKLGSIGGADPSIQYKPGSVGIISKSGGMSSEISLIVKKAGLGQSTVIGMGGDVIVGTAFHEFLELFENDEQTQGVVVFGELGGTYEAQMSEFIKAGRFTKPVVAFIGGEFASNLPAGQAFGHAGALIEGDSDRPQTKKKLLEAAGVKIAKVPGELGEMIKKEIEKRH